MAEFIHHGFWISEAGVRPATPGEIRAARSMVGKLLPSNCFANFEVAGDGRCYSSTCMMNVDSVLAEKIAKNGCRCFEQFRCPWQPPERRS